LHLALERIYGQPDTIHLVNIPPKLQKWQRSVKNAFQRASKHIHQQKGFHADMMNDDEVKQLINSSYGLFNNALNENINEDVSDTLVHYLRENIFVFSGMKTYTQLKEASSLLLDENKQLKPWHKFQLEVSKVHKKYNEHYLQAEYQFATGSALMAEKWQQLSRNSDRYHLLYRTAGDTHVRQSHQELHDTTLPASDPFWSMYYPPNGWRCFVAGTKILTSVGWKNIEEIQQFEKVLGGSGNMQFVISTHTNNFNGNLITLFSKRMFVSCTPNHRFITQRGWLTSNCIQQGDIIIQIAKVSFFYKIINAVHNIKTLILYGFMAIVRKWKTVSPLKVNN